jgi:phosphoglycolate phosphatase-like HAD superfamily hydrolase
MDGMKDSDMFLGSRPERPIVALDIDGTIADYYGHFLEFAENWTGRTLEEDWGRTHDGEFSDAIGLDKDEYRQIKLAYRQGGMKRTLPIFGGVKAIVDAIHQQGVEVWFCTTRPWARLDNIDPDTRHWLERHELRFNGAIFSETKYQDLVDIVGKERVVCVVDDLPTQITTARNLGLKTILHRGPQNAWWDAPTDVVQVSGTSNMKTQVLESIKQFRFPSQSDRGDFGMPGIGSARLYSIPGKASAETPNIRYLSNGPKDILLSPEPEGIKTLETFINGVKDVQRSGVDATLKVEVDEDPDRIIANRILEAMKDDLGLPDADATPRPSQQAVDVAAILNDAIDLFMQKNRGYGNTADELGTKGQFADMNRKWGKMKKMMWTEELPMFPNDDVSEDIIQILMDMIGHCGLSVYYIRQEHCK